MSEVNVRNFGHVTYWRLIFNTRSLNRITFVVARSLIASNLLKARIGQSSLCHLCKNNLASAQLHLALCMYVLCDACQTVNRVDVLRNFFGRTADYPITPEWQQHLQPNTTAELSAESWKCNKTNYADYILIGLKEAHSNTLKCFWFNFEHLNTDIFNI